MEMVWNPPDDTGRSKVNEHHQPPEDMGKSKGNTHRQRSAMDRLSLPRRNYPASDIDVSPQKFRPGLPPRPLPTWVTLPMDAKLPMIPGPQNNVQLYTTNLGEKMHKSTPDLDFDLTDPYSMVMSNDYKPLHDPHLKSHVDTTQMRKRLLRGKFITRDGKVICTLREYNQYRQYLRKINLALDRKHDSEWQGKEWHPRVGTDGDNSNQSRENRVRRMRQRLQQQYEEDKARYRRLMAEEEERRQRFKERELSRLTEKERLHRLEQEQKQALIQQKQDEDQQRKLVLLKAWMTEDKQRRALAESRRKMREKERHKTLEDTWDERHQIQKLKLEHEQQVRLRAEELTKHRIAEREQTIQRQRARQLAVYRAMREQQRKERERQEEECARRITERMEWKRSHPRRRQGHQRKRSARKGRRTLRSNWSMTRTLLQEFSDVERSSSTEQHTLDEDLEKDERPSSDRDTDKLVDSSEKRSLRKEPPCPPKQYSGLLHAQFECRGAIFSGKLRDLLIKKKRRKLKEKINRTKSSLRLNDFRDAKFKVRFVEPLKKRSRMSRHYFQMAKDKFGEEKRYMECDIQAQAKFIVQVNTYLASKVIYPAFLALENEQNLGMLGKRSVHFSTGHEVLPGLSDSYTTPLEEDYQWAAGTDDEDEEEMEVCTSLTLMSATDSLTKLRRTSSAARPERPVLRGLADILSHILDLHTAGELSREKATRLANAAKEILGDGSIIFLSPSSSEASEIDLSRSSSTSLVAADVVRRTLESVHNELLTELTEEELANLYVLAPEGSTTSSQLSGMAKFVAETALAMAAESLIGCADEILESLPLASPKLGRDSAASDTALLTSASPRRLKKSASQESVSCTSHFILNVLEKVLSEVRAEHNFPASPTTEAREPRSETSFYIQDMLHRAVRETLAVVSVERLHMMPIPTSTTSVFVLNTLEKVVDEMQKTRQPSATSLYIEDLLSRVAQERISTPDLSWDQTFNIHVKRSNASATSMFIRDTLSRVLHQIEADLPPQPTLKVRSVASVFAEEIVNATLRKCGSAVRQDMLPCKKLAELTATIICSQESISRQEDSQHSLGETGTGRNIRDPSWNTAGPTLSPVCSGLRVNSPLCVKSLDTVNDNFRSTSSSLVEDLIRETLLKAQDALHHGAISTEDVVSKMKKIVSGSSNVLEVGGKPIVKNSCTEAEAATYIHGAIDDALAEVSTSSSKNMPVEPAHSSSSPKDSNVSPSLSQTKHVSRLVGSIIVKSVHQLQEGLTDDVTIKLIEKTIKRSLQDMPHEEEPRETPTETVPSCEKILLKEQSPEETSDTELGALLEDSSSEEDMVKLQPVFEGKQLDIDQSVICKALGAISVRNLEEMDDPTQALPRNSFASLIKPNITNISGIDTSSARSVKDELVRASKGQLPSQTRLVLTAASRCSQTTGKPPMQGALALKAKGLKTTSLKQIDRQESPVSPYSSPESSPQSSKTRLAKAALIGASAPALKTVSHSTSKQIPKPQSSTSTAKPAKNNSNTKSASPKQSLTGNSNAPKAPSLIPSEKEKPETSSYPRMVRKRSPGTMRAKDTQTVSTAKISPKNTAAVRSKQPSKTKLKENMSSKTSVTSGQDSTEEAPNAAVDATSEDSPALIKSLCGSHATIVRQVSPSSSQSCSPRHSGTALTSPKETRSQDITDPKRQPSQTIDFTSNSSMKSKKSNVSQGKSSTSSVKKSSKTSRNSHQSLDLTPRPSSVFGQSHNSGRSSKGLGLNQPDVSDVSRGNTDGVNDRGSTASTSCSQSQDSTPSDQSKVVPLEPKLSRSALGGLDEQPCITALKKEGSSSGSRIVFTHSDTTQSDKPHQKASSSSVGPIVGTSKQTCDVVSLATGNQ